MRCWFLFPAFSSITGSLYELNWVGLAIMGIAIIDMVFCLLLWHSVFFYEKKRIVPLCIILLFLEIPIFVLAWAAHAQLDCNMEAFNRRLTQYLLRLVTTYLSYILQSAQKPCLEWDIACKYYLFMRHFQKQYSKSILCPLKFISLH